VALHKKKVRFGETSVKLETARIDGTICVRIYWETGNTRFLVSRFTDTGGLAFYAVGFLPHDCWDCGFENHLISGLSSFVFLCVSRRWRSLRHAVHSFGGMLPDASLIVCYVETSKRGGLGPILTVASQKKKGLNSF